MVPKTEIKKTNMSSKQKLVNPLINLTSRFGFFDAYSIMRKYFGSQILILTYHRIGPDNNNWLLPPTNMSDFENQIKYLTKTHKIMPLNELAKAILEEKSLDGKIAVVTFDDGYKDSYQYAFPILKKYNIPATIFLVTGHIDTGNMFWYDKLRYAIWNTKIKRLKLDGFGDYPLNSFNNRLQSIHRIEEKFNQS